MLQPSFTVANSNIDNPQVYDFSAPVDLKKFVLEDPLFLKIVGTAAFKRLAEIRFLGGIDYLIVRSPNGAPSNTRYTRFQHSLGVARLALMYGRACQLPMLDRRLIFTAALLHDIGHAPLSHSLEPEFAKRFGIDHHQATREILKGYVPIGRELYKLLREYAIDVDQLISVIAGQKDAYHNFFSGPINFDTIEGILRTVAYAKSDRSVVVPEVVVDAAVNRSSTLHRDLVDQFWLSKDLVYGHLINSKMGVLADYVCQVFMERNLSEIQVEDYYSTEEQLFRKLPGLRQLLTSSNFLTQISNHVPEVIAYKRRRFFIDPSSDFFDRLDKSRYVQTKESSTFTFVPTAIREEHKTVGDLFSDAID